MEQLDRAIEALIACYRNGGKLLVCGNGGSASDSAHIVGELVKGFLKKRPLPQDWQRQIGTDKLQLGLPAIDLTAQGAVIAAVVNDLGGEYMFAQQVMAYANPGDMLIGISTSGNSKNVSYAVEVAKKLGMKTIALTGGTGGKLAEMCDIAIIAPGSCPADVQECHLPIYHALCGMLEAHFFG